jgi:hypothetical protein
MDAGSAERIMWLGISVGAGAVAYFLALMVLGMRPVQFRLRHD